MHTLSKRLEPDVFKFQFGGLGSIEVYTVSEPSLQRGQRLKMEFPGVYVSHMAGMKEFIYIHCFHCTHIWTGTPQMSQVVEFSTVASWGCSVSSGFEVLVFGTGSCLPRVMMASLGTFSRCPGSQPWTCLDCSRWQADG